MHKSHRDSFSTIITQLFVTLRMVLLVLEAELGDGTNRLDLHDIWPGLQKGGILSRIYREGMLGKVMERTIKALGF